MHPVFTSDLPLSSMLALWWVWAGVLNVISARVEIRYLVRTEAWSAPDKWDAFWAAVPALPASEADDTPVDRVVLPFAFPFLSQYHSVGFVNPNGALAFDPAPPCGAYFGSVAATRALSCTTNSSWHGLIAAYVADLDPGSAAAATVKARSCDDGECWRARWTDVPKFGVADSGLTFSVTLWPQGLLEIAHEAVSSSSSSDESVLVGVRFAVNNEMSEDAEGVFASASSAQAVRQQQLFNTEALGAYPGIMGVRSETRVLACPVAVEWCVSNSTVANGSEVLLTSAVFGCDEMSFEWRCAFVAEDTRYVVGRSLVSFSQSATGGAEARCAARAPGVGVLRVGAMTQCRVETIVWCEL